jgi:NAD(P)-dependent dehydrogenase (short-subunit alcohol dehydrogenase family)
MFEKGLLAGKRILVTGGASGLGAAMGRRFVALGAELIICGRRLELLEAAAARMRKDLGGKVAAIRCDIRDGAAVDAMMDAIWREAPLDVLVNNAAATFIAQTERLRFVPRTRFWRRRCMARCIVRSLPASAGSKESKRASCSASSRPRPSPAALSRCRRQWRSPPFSR